MKTLSSKQPKIKTHILWVSPRFPFDHSRKGEPTYFKEKILSAITIGANNYSSNFTGKLHTCRGNAINSKSKIGVYESWKRKIDEVNRGEAILSLRMWSASPYNQLHDGSKPIEIAQFNKYSVIGVQKLEFRDYLYGIYVDDKFVECDTLSKNDGLSHADFEAWFIKTDLSKPMAIIHFTKFRY